MAAAREKFYRGLSTFDTFGKGWLRRNQETLEVALTMVGKKTVIGKIASSLGF
jgi:lysozyme family protein